MSSEPADDKEVHYPDPGVDTSAISEEAKQHVTSRLTGPRRIDIWSEAGFPDTFHKQIGFTIWYTTRAMRDQAISEGEDVRLETLLREECIKRGFPESQKDRIYVWTDSHQALSRLMGRESDFKEWIEKVEPDSLKDVAT